MVGNPEVKVKAGPSFRLARHPPTIADLARSFWGKCNGTFRNNPAPPAVISGL